MQKNNSMKKIFFSITAIACVLLVACSPKAGKTTATTVTPSKQVVDPMETQLTAAKTKYPDATTDQLQKGSTLYFGEPCTRCHSAKTITDFSAEELPGIIEHMAKKARISAEEKDALLKYVMGVRLAAK
jgi:hypothetical protein